MVEVGSDDEAKVPEREKAFVPVKAVGLAKVKKN
jgi:hypothetical protein